MKLSRKAKSFMSKAFMAAGAIPVIAGAGTVLTDGLTGAFNTISAMGGLQGGLLAGAGAVLGGASLAMAAYKAMDKGYFGKMDMVAGALFVLVACPGIGIAGAFLGATGTSKIASMITAPDEKQAVQEVEHNKTMIVPAPDWRPPVG